jgi:hypothetical protein
MSYTDIDRVRDACESLIESVSNNPEMRISFKTWKSMEHPLKRLIKEFDRMKKERAKRLQENQK